MKTPFSSKLKFDYSDRLKNKLIKRHQLTVNLCPEKFNRTFWMKWELTMFCKRHSLNKSGTKKILKKRICEFLARNK